MKTTSKIGLAALALFATLALPALAQDCSDGRLWVPGNSKTVEVAGFCKDVNVAGNNNTVTVGRIGDLKVGGDNNVINYREKTSGAEPKHWFGGNGNKLVFIGDSAARSAPAKRAAAKPKAPARQAPKKKTAQTSAPANLNGRAPHLFDIPGPRVKVTGKMLGKLPAGYRMHVYTTNYWTNRAMTSTRMQHLRLTKDGQFEKSRFSISGGSTVGPNVGVITSRDKKGSTGSVSGNTNPGGSGAKSVYLKKRDGLDGSMYGTYYISGNTLELRYANGALEKHSFKTDGYHTLLINGKKYFSGAPTGWEVKPGKGNKKYRKADGSRIAYVSKLDYPISDGEAWLKDYLARSKAKNKLVSATPIKKLNGRLYGIAKTTVVMRSAETGNEYTRDVYVRHGRNSRMNRFINVIHYKGSVSEEEMILFIERASG